MKIYVAGLYAATFNIGGRLFNRLTDLEKQHRESIPDILESYHYVHKQNHVDRMRNNKVKIFLDSGAFSAFTQGVDIDIDGYIEYIKQNHDIIECSSVLDGIGDPLKTYQNQCYMESKGTRPLPCFHYGEDERYLEYYIEKYDHITLGGMVPISTKPLRLWLDTLWHKYLTDSAGRPKLKVHGFGLTTMSLMKRYPWYSVDSSSWVQQAANGNIFVPEIERSIPVSHNSPSLKQFNRHLDNMAEEKRNQIIQWVEQKGYDLDRMRHIYLARWVFNAWVYGVVIPAKINKEDHKFKQDQMRLFE